jgi:hypothetical protein
VSKWYDKNRKGKPQPDDTDDEMCFSEIIFNDVTPECGSGDGHIIRKEIEDE